MTIHNMPLFLNGLWDWAFLDGCFGQTKIRPTDVDGQVHTRFPKDRYLELEAKSINASIPTGQRMKFDSYLRVNREIGRELFTILVFWGNADTKEITHMRKWGTTERIACSMQDVRQFVYDWFNNHFS